jgi:type I restriction enzyme M protein
MQPGYNSPLPRHLRWGSWAADPEGATGDTLLAFINERLFPGLRELPIVGSDRHRQRVVRSVFEDAYNYMKSGVPPSPSRGQDQ